MKMGGAFWGGESRRGAREQRVGEIPKVGILKRGGRSSLEGGVFKKKGSNGICREKTLGASASFEASRQKDQKALHEKGKKRTVPRGHEEYHSGRRSPLTGEGPRGRVTPPFFGKRGEKVPIKEKKKEMALLGAIFGKESLKPGKGKKAKERSIFPFKKKERIVGRGEAAY